MSLLEQLIRQLGSVEIDASGLVLEVDGKPVPVERGIKITVATTAAVAPTQVAAKTSVPVSNAPSVIPEAADAQSPANTVAGPVDEDEWEWQIALARARVRADEDARQERTRTAAHLRRIEQLQRVLKPTRMASERPLPPRRFPRRSSPKLADQLRMMRPRRVAQGTAPPVPTDDDITKPIDIHPLPDRPRVDRVPPPLPPPPED